MAPLSREICDATGEPRWHTTLSGFITVDKLVSSRLKMRSGVNEYFSMAAVYAVKKVLTEVLLNATALAIDIPSGALRARLGCLFMNE